MLNFCGERTNEKCFASFIFENHSYVCFLCNFSGGCDSDMKEDMFCFTAASTRLMWGAYVLSVMNVTSLPSGKHDWKQEYVFYPTKYTRNLCEEVTLLD